MRNLLILLLLIMLYPLMGSFLLEQIEFIPSEYDEAALRQASGLSKGSRIEYDQIILAEQLIREYLAQRGDYYVQVSHELIPIEEDRVRLSFTLQPLVNTGEVGLRFEGMRYFTEAKLRELLYLSADAGIALIDMEGLLNRIASLYSERGYIFAKAELASLVMPPSPGAELPALLVAIISIDEGPLFRMEDVLCEGNFYTRCQSLVRLSGLRQVSRITPSVLSQARQRILAKPYIQDCEIIPLDASRLLIRVKEGKMTYLEGVAGLNRQSGKAEINGLINLRFQNLWGTDRAIRLYWKSLPKISQSLELEYHESGWERYPVAADLALSRLSQDSTWVKSKIRTDIYYFNQSHQLGAEISFEELSPGSRRPILVERKQNRSIGAIWNYSGTDHPTNPSRGSSSSLRYRYFISADADDPNTALEASAATYLPISNRWVTAARINLNSLDRAIEEDYYLYRMGGFNSLRGYRESSFSSWRLGWYNLEMRYRLNTSSRFYGFFDQGVYLQGKDSFRAMNFAVGIGLKYGTRLGILSLEYALGYREDGMWDLGRGIIHLGLDSSF